MKSFILLGLASLAVAQSSSCPVGMATVNGVPVCCPGGFATNNGAGTFCVLGCTVGQEPCFPFCTEDGTSNGPTTSGSCTSIPVTATDYSSRVGLTGGAGAATTTSAGSQTTSAGSTQTNSSGTTQTSSSGTTSQPSAAGTTQSGSTSSSATATTSTTSSSSSPTRNAAAMMTAAPFMIVGAIAGAMIV